MYEAGNPANPAGFTTQASAPGCPIYSVPPGTYPPQMPSYAPVTPGMPYPGHPAPPSGCALPAYASVNQPNADVAALRAQLEREQMKNDLRVEMQTASKLAVLEATARTNPGAPTTVNNNMQAVSAGTPYGAPSTVVVMERERRFCGPLTCLIWFFFPCICFCPVDTR